MDVDQPASPAARRGLQPRPAHSQAMDTAGEGGDTAPLPLAAAPSSSLEKLRSKLAMHRQNSMATDGDGDDDNNDDGGDEHGHSGVAEHTGSAAAGAASASRPAKEHELNTVQDWSAYLACQRTQALLAPGTVPLAQLYHRATAAIDLETNRKEEMYIQLWLEENCVEDARDVYDYMKNERIGQRFRFYFTSRATFESEQGNGEKCHDLLRKAQRCAQPSAAAQAREKEFQLFLSRLSPTSENAGAMAEAGAHEADDVAPTAGASTAAVQATPVTQRTKTHHHAHAHFTPATTMSASRPPTGTISSARRREPRSARRSRPPVPTFSGNIQSQSQPRRRPLAVLADPDCVDPPSAAAPPAAAAAAVSSASAAGHAAGPVAGVSHPPASAIHHVFLDHSHASSSDGSVLSSSMTTSSSSTSSKHNSSGASAHTHTHTHGHSSHHNSSSTFHTQHTHGQTMDTSSDREPTPPPSQRQQQTAASRPPPAAVASTPATFVNAHALAHGSLPTPLAHRGPAKPAPAPAPAPQQLSYHRPSASAAHPPPQPFDLSASQFTVNGQAFTKLDRIGKGGSSMVYRVLGEDRRVYALKEIEITDQLTLKTYMNEIDLLTKVQHSDHVVKLYHYEVRNDHIYMVMECGEADLSKALRDRRKLGPLGENLIRLYWQQMLEAVQVIHDARVVHADLKPANFLVVGGAIKLIDFGIATNIQDDQTSAVRDSAMGTINYMAPEAVQEHAHVGPRTCWKVCPASDVWSLGCILYSMVYGHTPFHNLPPISKLQKIVDPTYKIPFPALADHNLLAVLKNCLQRDPKKRMSIAELLQHPYLSPSVHAASGAASMQTPPRVMEGGKVLMTKEQLRDILRSVPSASPNTMTEQIFARLPSAPTGGAEPASGQRPRPRSKLHIAQSARSSHRPLAPVNLNIQ